METNRRFATSTLVRPKDVRMTERFKIGEKVTLGERAFMLPRWAADWSDSRKDEELLNSGMIRYDKRMLCGDINYINANVEYRGQCRHRSPRPVLRDHS